MICLCGRSLLGACLRRCAEELGRVEGDRERAGEGAGEGAGKIGAKQVPGTRYLTVKYNEMLNQELSKPPGAARLL